MLWLAFLLSLLLQTTFTRSQYYGHDVIRIRARGFLPYGEQDILPYAVISRLIEQQQQLQRKRLGRDLPYWMKTSVKGYMSSQLPSPPMSIRQRQIRHIEQINKKHHQLANSMNSPSNLASDRLKLQTVSKRYRIYDGDDGERLLDLRVHRHHANKEEEAAEPLPQTQNKWKVTVPLTAINASNLTKEKKIVQHYFLHLK